MNFCPYYDVSNESYARLNAMIETMNDQHEHFIGEMREFSLLLEINPNLPLPRRKASLYDHFESFLPRESNFADDAPSTDPEEVIDPLLTSLPFVALSSSRPP